MPEVWKDVPGYEGRYQVSDLGRVKSLPRVGCFNPVLSVRVIWLLISGTGGTQNGSRCTSW